MRCARCDRVVIRQAVGRAPDGRVVFGWCLDCMAEQRCGRIQVARGGRLFGGLKAYRAGRSLSSQERRARGLAAVAVLLILWGATFAAVGAWKTWHSGRLGAAAAGRGMPVVLVIGGAALALAGLTLAGIALARAPWFWRVLEWLLFACAVIVLVLGVIQYDPRRAPWMVALAGFAIALSGLVHQRRRLHVGPARPDDPDRSTEFMQDDDSRGDWR